MFLAVLLHLLLVKLFEKYCCNPKLNEQTLKKLEMPCVDGTQKLAYL